MGAARAGRLLSNTTLLMVLPLSVCSYEGKTPVLLRAAEQENFTACVRRSVVYTRLHLPLPSVIPPQTVAGRNDYLLNHVVTDDERHLAHQCAPAMLN